MSRRATLEDDSFQVRSMRNGLMEYRRHEEQIGTKAIFHMKTRCDEHSTDR
jgi:hypothetical protein